MGRISEKEKSIFLSAIERVAPDQWPAYLDEACAADEVLRANVEQLLAAQAKLGTFYEVPRSSVDVTAENFIADRLGTFIGPYKLIEQIGEGGMGIVYVAEQKEPVSSQGSFESYQTGHGFAARHCAI